MCVCVCVCVCVYVCVCEGVSFEVHVHMHTQKPTTHRSGIADTSFYTVLLASGVLVILDLIMHLTCT